MKIKTIGIYIFDSLFNPSKMIVKKYKLSRKLHQKKLTRYLRYLPWLSIVKKYNCYLSPKSNIHLSIYFPHPTGIVIGDGVIVEEGCVIYQHVTIGAKRKGEGKQNLYPKIGKNSIIYAGAVIVGSIEIGEGSIVAANSVVNKSCPPNSVLAGAPAKIVNAKLYIEKAHLDQ